MLEQLFDLFYHSKWFKYTRYYLYSLFSIEYFLYFFIDPNNIRIQGH